jgi:hypothetical protein
METKRAGFDVTDLDREEIIEGLFRCNMEHLSDEYIFHERTIDALRELKENEPERFAKLKQQFPGSKKNDLVSLI